MDEAYAPHHTPTYDVSDGHNDYVDGDGDDDDVEYAFFRVGGPVPGRADYNDV